MTWKEWPYWLKGGLISAGFFFGISLISYLTKFILSFISRLKRFNSTLEGTSVCEGDCPN